MNELNDARYYITRAERSRELARAAVDPTVAAIHLDFALRYEAIVAQIACATAESTGTAQPSMQVVLVESGDLHQLAGVHDRHAAAAECHRPR